MKSMFALAIARFVLALAIILPALAATSTPPVVAVDGAGGAETFAGTGSLIAARNNHTATLLADGKVLVTGGFGDSGALDSTEIYDPTTGEWTATGSLNEARYNHRATLLADGKVLVSGGHGISIPLDSAEIYDPATGEWTATGSLEEGRYQHTATLLGNGKVLVAGGYNYFAGDYLDSAEIYDPATGEWTGTGSLATARFVHTATLLASGKVLVTGGADLTYIGSSELYDPATGEWTGTGSLTTARYVHTATLLGSGAVLVVGGYGENFYLDSAEIYDPVAGSWTDTGSLVEARYNHTASPRADGKVIVTGGLANSGSLGTSELFDPASGEWSATGGLAAARYNHTATPVAGGKILISGGYGESGNLDSAEIYTSAEIPSTPEGSLFTRTGTFSDPDGNGSVTLTASTGAISQDDMNGTWSWSATPEDGPASIPVTITATDDQGAAATVDFTFTVTNVPPTASITTPPGADEDAPVSISFSAADPGGLDQAAGFAMAVDYGDGASGTFPAGTTSPLEQTHIFANPGSFTITARSTDKDGGESLLASRIITIADVTPPVITPHADVGPIEATGPAGATVIYDPATATDNSENPVTDIDYSPNSGTVFPLGVSTVTITATDGSGNSSTSDFDVTVVDTTPPVAEAPPGGFDPLTVGTGILPDYTSQLVSDDVVGVTLVVQDPPAGSAVPIGPVSVSLVARDAAGNSSPPVSFEVMVTSSGLVNGSFEAGYDGWTLAGNQSIQSSAPYAATDGSQLVSFNDGNRAPGGTLTQSFPTSPGEIYQLSFDMGVLAYNAFQQRLGVELNGSSTLLSQGFNIGSSGSPVRWETRTLRFMADSATTTLIFRDLSQATSSIDLTLDNVAIVPLITRTLTVTSSPAAGAAITVSPPDNDAMANGVSSFTRRYLDGMTVNLTAASANNGFRFQKWLKNGADFSTEKVVSVVMDGNLTLNAVYVDSPPLIITQPVGGAVALGGTTTLSVIAEGTGTLTYQWRLNRTEIPGAESPDYVINNMQSGDVGDYDVVVSNEIGPVTSETAAVSLVTAMLVNGSFEAGYDGWTFSGNQVIADSAPYAATDGVRLVAFNDTNRAPNGTLEQTFATTPGRSYTLTFDAGVLSYNTESQALLVTVTGTGSLLSRTVVIPGSTGDSLRWLPQNFTFVANSPTSTLAFADRSASTSNLDLLLDHVSISEGIDVPNTAPVAADDHYATTLNTDLVILAPGVIANDSDADSSPLAATINTDPQHGVVTLNANGGFTYTPVTGFTGSDSFTYHVNDGGLDSNIATVTLEVNPPSTELLFNGGFEAGFTGWITTGNQFVQTGAPYAPTEGSKLASFNAGNMAPNAVLSQSFATVAGQSYTLAFDLGAISYNTSTQTMKVTVSGTGDLLSEVITITGPGGGTNRWLSQVFTFVANSPISTLTFRDQSGTTNAIDLMLDHVRVTGVASLAMVQPVLGGNPMEFSGFITAASSAPPTEEMVSPTLAGTPGDITIVMTATGAGDYQLECSEDLLHWERLGGQRVEGPGFLEFRDTVAPSGGRKFYRIGRRTGAP